MWMLRSAIVLAMTFVFAPAGPLGAAEALTKITVGKATGGSGFHIPSYIAMDKGFFKDEGLDARFVELTGKALVTAGISGNVDFIPIPSGGSQAALSGAEIRYVVGQSLKSQWLIVARPNINKPEDLRGKTLGYGRCLAQPFLIERIIGMPLNPAFFIPQCAAMPNQTYGCHYAYRLYSI